jgi:spoIIIJ-associated protein
MAEIERSAASVEEAIEAALAELGISEQEAHVEIVQEGRSGFLGLAGQPAIVRVRATSATPRGGPPEESSEELEEQLGVAEEFVRGLLERMGLQADVEPAVVDGAAYVDVWGRDDGDDVGILIGRRGHTLESLQELVRSVVYQRTGERCEVLVDVEDYRKRRRSRLVRMAQDAAVRVRKTGRPEALEPMNAYERKIVHDTVAGIGGLATASEGEEPNRRVVIRRS